MSARGANVTVTIGATFAGSFKSVLREADRELKNSVAKTARMMKAAAGAHGAMRSTAKELHSLTGGAAHTAVTTYKMCSLASPISKPIVLMLR